MLTDDPRKQELIIRFEELKTTKKLGGPGVTRKLLWEEYSKEYSCGYSYTQFCIHFKEWMRQKKVTAHFEHRPGDQLMVDFTGKKLGYVDRATGEVIACEVFVGVLPSTGFTYAEVVPTQQQPDFVEAVGNALHYLGGVPKSVLCDNLRTAVKKSDRYEPSFTEVIDQLSLHYNTTFMATRPNKPKDKAAVEGAVKLVYQRIFAPLRHETFYSIQELNIAVREQLDKLNDRPLSKRTQSRRDLFEAREQRLLKVLPTQLFAVKKTVNAKAQKNYHVILGEDWHQYSVPYQLSGKQCKIVYGTDEVEIYCDLKRVALHKRDRRRNGYSTLKDHMPANHRHYYAQKGWDEDYFKKQARLVGPCTLQSISMILDSRVFPEQTYKSCLGVLRLGSKYGNDRLEAACKRITEAGAANYGMVKNILEKRLDQLPDQASLDFTTPSHENLRGANHYS